jgi:hypothetical protein
MKIILIAAGLFAVIAATAILVKQWDERQVAEASLKIAADSLKAVKHDQLLVNNANAAAKAKIDSLAAQNALSDTKIERATRVSDSLEKELRSHPRPALADSVNPAWMHRSLVQDTTITVDSGIIVERTSQLQRDSAQIYLFRIMHLRDSVQTFRAISVADSMGSQLKIMVTKSGCGLPSWIPCLTRRQIFVLSALGGGLIAKHL